MQVTGFTHMSRCGNSHRAELRFHAMLTGSAPEVPIRTKKKQA
jgi:hypothetical protein